MFKVLLVLGGLGGLFAAVAERQPTPLVEEVKSLDEWVRVFESREADDRRGGVKVHRLLEVDPLPPQTPTRLLNICLKCSEDLSRTPASSPVEGLKKQFWEEIKPLGLSLLHPMCVRMMAECGDVLSAEEFANLVTEHPVLINSNYDLLTRVKDYSLLTPEHVQTVFETPLTMGLNIATLPNALKTLPAESLAKLLEMMAWDVEDWEMTALIDARGGLQGLITDLNDHLNSWNMLMKFPWIINELITTGQFKSMIPRILESLESGNYVKEQMFMALVNLIVTQEHMLAAPKVSHIHDISSSVLADKLKIKSLLKESSDLGDLYDLICTPLSSHQYSVDNTLYENELSDTFEEFLDYWRELVNSYLGESNFFITSAYARNLFHLILQSFPESDADMAIDFFYGNRLHVMHHDSIFAMKRVWPFNEKVLKVERDLFDPQSSDISSHPVFARFRALCFEAKVYRVIFNDSKSLTRETASEAIGAWVTWQMQLQAAGALLKQFGHVYIAQRLLPVILKDEGRCGC